MSCWLYVIQSFLLFLPAMHFLICWQIAEAKWKMSNNMAKIADARKTVEQLKLEVNIERMMVSEHLMGLQTKVNTLITST